jgi:hypothetical protein
MPEGSGDRIHPQTQAGISMKCHLQTFLTVEPPKPLLIHRYALSRQQKMQTPIAEAWANGRKCADAKPHRPVVRGQAPVTDRRAIDT